MTAAPGTAGLEIHLNHFFQGTTTPSPQGEVPTEHLTHLTFEPHLGITPWWELGCYLQTVLRPDGHWDSGGFKLRTKFRWPESLGPVRLALNIEVSRVSKLYEADGWGSELRPIVDARWGPLYVSFNPIVDIPLAGGDAWKPEFQPAEKVSLDLEPHLGGGGRAVFQLRPVRESAAGLGADPSALRGGGRLHPLGGDQLRRGLRALRTGEVDRQGHRGDPPSGAERG